MLDDEITVLVAAPEGVDSDHLVTALESKFEVTGRCSSLDDALAAAVETVPDVLLLHRDVDGGQFADFARRLYDSVPITRLVLLTDSDDGSIYECVRNGVFAIVPPDVDTGDIIDATRSAARRESVISSNVARSLLNELTALSEPDLHSFSRAPRLTMTEKEVLSLMAGGENADQIANRHDVTARLVNLHVGYAVAKLQQHLAQQRKLVNQ